jgi:methylphosphotriester-DNA--protein-cysteine methyltransferase
MLYATDATRWRAVATRDSNANGHFVYSVRSTKIYCRPVCPGRLARRANVGFYQTPVEAEAAGFRACKRCKPNSVQEDSQERTVEKACLLIDEALKSDGQKTLKLQDLAKRVGLTPRYFHKIFKDKTGTTPAEYAKARMADDSSSITPTLATTETSTTTQPSTWDLFDFNDLVNFGIDLSPQLTDGFSTDTESWLGVELGPMTDLNTLPQQWGSGADFVTNDKLIDPILALPESFGLQNGEPIPASSTLELDAAILFGGDLSPDAFLNEPVYS